MNETPVAWWQLALSTETHVLGILAWPVLVLLALLLFRKQITALLTSLSSLTIAGVGLKWDRVVNEVRADIKGVEEPKTAPPRSIRPLMSDYYAEEARSNPAGAVVKSYVALEEALRRKLEETGWARNTLAPVLTVQQLATELVNRRLIPSSTMRAIDGLNTLRNLAVHAQGGELDAANAEEFLRLVDSVMYVIDAP